MRDPKIAEYRRAAQIVRAHITVGKTYEDPLRKNLLGQAEAVQEAFVTLFRYASDQFDARKFREECKA